MICRKISLIGICTGTTLSKIESGGSNTMLIVFTSWVSRPSTMLKGIPYIIAKSKRYFMSCPTSDSLSNRQEELLLI
jgi:hypothetical protein